MSSFKQTLRPTPFAFFDSDPAFQSEADGIVLFVKRKLGDDILSVELTQRQIWACLEEATLEYARYVQEMKIVSTLANVLGQSTGSTDLTNRYPQRSLDYLLRMADAYAYQAGVGGSYDPHLGFITLTTGTQDYNLYTSLYDSVQTGSLLTSLMPTGSVGKMRIIEVFHFEPSVSHGFLINASNMANYMATNFNYESYTIGTAFYMLPVFEDVLRRGAMKEAMRVRRSNYSYQLMGGQLRIYPIPSYGGRVYVKVAPPIDIFNPDFQDDTIYGISGPENVPFSILPYGSITVPGRQWIRQYTLALAKEILGLVRSKFQTVPIPNAELTLNGESLLSQAREDKDKLATQLQEFLAQLTDQKMMEAQASIAEMVQKQLRYIPMPLGKAITRG